MNPEAIAQMQMLAAEADCMAGEKRQRAAEAELYAAEQRGRPSVLFRPELKRQKTSGRAAEGHQWVARYGDVLGEGYSPESAMVAFDAAWFAKEMA